MNTFTGKRIISELMTRLNTSRTQLAAMLNVSERALSDWEHRNIEELTTEKGKRLRRLDDVVHFVIKNVDEEALPFVRQIIEDGRIPMENTGEDNTISLLSYICACPDEKGWKANAQVAITEYLEHARRRKHNRAFVS